jgi:hypothetical protein
MNGHRFPTAPENLAGKLSSPMIPLGAGCWASYIAGMDTAYAYYRVELPEHTAYFEALVGAYNRCVVADGEDWRFGSRFVEQVLDQDDPPLPDFLDYQNRQELQPISEQEFAEVWQRAVQGSETVPLFCAADPEDLQLLEAIGWSGWPRINPDKPIFCPVPTEDHASRITRESQTAKFGVGYVVRFEIIQAFMARYPRHRMHKRAHEEYWIPWRDLTDFNNHLVGPLVTVDEYHKAAQRPNIEGGRELLALTRPKVRATRGLGETMAEVIGDLSGGGPAAPRRPGGATTGDPFADFGT